MSIRPVNPPPTGFLEWSEEQRTADLARFLAEAPEPDDLWVFAIGSLIWDPRFEPAETRRATLAGWRRAFSFWAVRGRGSFETPGLGLALERGGSCAGVAFRLPRDGREEVLRALWLREMLGGVYVPAWVRVESAGEGGPEPVPAICFTANPTHPNYAGILPDDVTARYLASACGPRGTCAEYLFLLAEALARHGLEDAHVEDLARRVRAHLEAERRGAAP